jgi:hypothetical protein
MYSLINCLTLLSSIGVSFKSKSPLRSPRLYFIRSVLLYFCGQETHKTAAQTERFEPPCFQPLKKRTVKIGSKIGNF